jgi:hyperosmotically inducible protein
VYLIVAKGKNGMNFNVSFRRAVVLLGVLLLSSLAVPARAALQDTQRPAPDNTKTNERDKDKTSPTADQQKMNPDDRTITKKIRMAIHQDKSLSTYAHNIKIITQDGKVTLKGPVSSEDEKNNVFAKATAVAGDGNVTNEIDVAPSKQ